MFAQHALITAAKKSLSPFRKLQRLDQTLVAAFDADESDRPIQDAWCCEFDGVVGYIKAAHLTGAETVTEHFGVLPVVVSGRIDFPAGRSYGFTLSDGTRYTLGEKYGTIAFDASGNGNHGTLMNGVSRVIDGTMPPEADKNNLEGYTIGASGELIPAAPETKDALGNPLQYIGNAYPVKPVKRNSYCGVFDGVNDYVDLVGLTGTETVVSHNGTAIPTIVSGRIDFTAGNCYDLLLSNGWRFNFSEGVGDVIHDTSGNGKHGTIMNAATTVKGQGFWAGRQDEKHFNLDNGFSFGISGVRIPAINATTDALGNPLTNPAIKNGHNRAETQCDPENITVTGQATPASTGLTNPITFDLMDSDLHLLTNDREFARTVSDKQADRYLGYQGSLADSSKPVIYTDGLTDVVEVRAIFAPTTDADDTLIISRTGGTGISVEVDGVETIYTELDNTITLPSIAHDFLFRVKVLGGGTLRYGKFSNSTIKELIYLNDDNITAFYLSFYGCGLLESVPSVINTTGKNVRSMFTTCFSLVEVPSVLDISHASDIFAMFDRCYKLKSLPEVLDLSSCVDASYAFKLTPITHIGNAVFCENTQCTNFTDAFFGCSLVESEVDKILVNIESNGTSNGTLGIHGGTNATPSQAGKDAADALVGRGWAVTLNGYIPTAP